MKAYEGPITRRKRALKSKPSEVVSLIKNECGSPTYRPDLIIPTSIHGNGYKAANISFSLKYNDEISQANCVPTQHPSDLNRSYYHDLNEIACNVDAKNCVLAFKASNSVEQESASEHEMHADIESSSSSSNYLAEILLLTNFLFMLIFFNVIKSADHRQNLEGFENIRFLSSFEQGLAFKILWCFVFGFVTDIFSWKAAFRCLAVLWVCLLIFKSLNVEAFIIRLLAAICFSSSMLLTSLIGISKIYEAKKSWPLFCRLRFSSSLFILCTQFVGTKQLLSLRNVIKERIEPIFQELDSLNYVIFLRYKFLPCGLIIGCVLCLVIIPQLCDERERNTTRILKNSPRFVHTSKVKCFLKIIALKLLFFLPASCYLILYNSYTERAIPMLIPVCLSFFCILPVCDRYINLRRLLFYLMSLLFLCYTLLFCDRYLHQYYDCKQLLSVVIPSVLTVLYPLFDFYVVTDINNDPFNDGLTGLIFASILSTHFIIKYLSYFLVTLKIEDIYSTSEFIKTPLYSYLSYFSLI